MANTFLNAVTAHQQLKGTVKSVALALANRADDSGSSFPSIKTLAADTGFSTSTVKRAIRSLRDNGYLKVSSRERKDGSHTSNFYTLLIEAFTGAIKKVKKAFNQAVKMGQTFVASKVTTIRPTSTRIGEHALQGLPEEQQLEVIEKLTKKDNSTLQDQLNSFGLDSAYVQKALANEVAQIKRQSIPKRRTIYEQLMDVSWADDDIFAEAEKL